MGSGGHYGFALSSSDNQGALKTHGSRRGVPRLDILGESSLEGGSFTEGVEQAVVVTGDDKSEQVTEDRELAHRVLCASGEVIDLGNSLSHMGIRRVRVP